MKIAILSANLGNFDTPVEPVEQVMPYWVDRIDYHCFTDADFPPITGLSPRLQYRIPKLFGYEMFPGYDIYVWLDGGMSLQNPESLKWFLEKLVDHEMVFFKHPWRNTIKEEVYHIEDKLQEGNKYIVSRYNNGLHKEQYKLIESDYSYRDTDLYASTMFVYRNTDHVQDALQSWWYYQSRYYTCDQVVLPYVLYQYGIDVYKIDEDLFHHPYISLVSKHK